MLPTWQTVGLLVKEMEQYFLVLDPEVLVQGRVYPATSRCLQSFLGDTALPTNGRWWLDWKQNWTYAMVVCGQHERDKVTQLGSDAPFQTMSSPGRRQGNRLFLLAVPGEGGGEGSTSSVSWGHPLGWLLLATEFGGFCFCEFYSLLMPMYVDLDTIVTLFVSC